MQYPNDDMDELFRRAAEDYPLNTHSADWNKVQAKLLPAEQPGNKEIKKGRFLWLLLLLPVSLICNRITDSGHRSLSMQKMEPLSPQVTSQTAGSEHRELKNAGVERMPVTVREKGGVAIFKIKDPVSSRRWQSADTALRQATPLTLIRKSAMQVRLIRKGIGSNSAAQSGFHANQTTAKLEPMGKDDRRLSGEAGGVVEGRDLVSRSSAILVFPEINLVPGEHAKQNATSAKKRRFYVGLLAGPDLSTIRFEKFSNVGFTAGVLLGYQAGRRFSLEVGALSSKKYYYSEGAYFNTKKLYLPANTEVLNVDGNCRMLELPLSLRYAFSKGDKHTWSVSAGLSSYLMKKENYTYDYRYWPSGNVVAHQKTYENRSRNWFSVFQFSVSNTSKLGRVGDLRLEPYYALPLKGIGYGELPLSSLGIRIALTSRHF